MANYKDRVKSPDLQLSNMTSANYTYIDGGVTTPIVVSPTACSLIRVILATNGATLNLKSGSRQINTIASDAPEHGEDYGIWCADGITVQAGGALSACIVWA
jgi:hypothetical protein